METGNLRKWHVAVGLSIFSAVMVWAYLQLEPQANPRTTSPMMFERSLFARPVGRTNPQPVVQDIRVYPPLEGLYVVNFVQLVPDRVNDRWLRQEWSFTAKTPTQGSEEDILSWLQRLQKQNPEIKFTYEWWREPKRLWTIWGVVAGVLTLWGVVLPTVMWVAKGGAKEAMANAKARPVEKDPLAPAAASQGVTREDRDRLDSMIDDLETSTSGLGVTSAAPAPSTGTAPAGMPHAPRVLSDKPLEQSAAPTKEDEHKEYKGEFYPVAKAGHAHPPTDKK